MLWFSKKGRVALNDLRISRDIHTHLLPGVDDGRFTYESAAATLAKMYTNGTTEVCITPHIITGLYDNTKTNLKTALTEVVKYADSADAIPRVHLGAEYMIDETFLSRLNDERESLMALPGNMVLIEMSYYGISPQLFEAVAGLRERGYKPVLAHPERYLYMVACMDQFDRLYQMGCAFQLNLLSATGLYGDTSIKIMNRLLERSYYGFTGSDMHSAKQFEQINSSFVSKKTALAGEHLSLWNINDNTGNY